MRQFLEVVALLCVWTFTSIFVMVVEMKPISMLCGRLERKKYPGMCRWEYKIVAWIMSRFPVTGSMYIE
jgi:hypothetical protein